MTQHSPDRRDPRDGWGHHGGACRGQEQESPARVPTRDLDAVEGAFENLYVYVLVVLGVSVCIGMDGCFY